MNYTFEEYSDKNTEIILGELESDIESLDLPKYVLSRLLDVIVNCEGEILEYRFEQSIADYEDRAYTVYKDSKLDL